MAGKIEIEVDDNGKLNTNSTFNLATSVVILEKVKTQLVQRSQIRRVDEEVEEGEAEEDDEADE